MHSVCLTILTTILPAPPTTETYGAAAVPESSRSSCSSPLCAHRYRNEKIISRNNFLPYLQKVQIGFLSTHSRNYLVSNTPLFLKKDGGSGEGKNFFSREKKFFPSPDSRSFSGTEDDELVDGAAHGGVEAAGVPAGIGGGDVKEYHNFGFAAFVFHEGKVVDF